ALEQLCRIPGLDRRGKFEAHDRSNHRFPPRTGHNNGTTRLLLCRPRRLEGRDGSRKCIEPLDHLRMAGTPLSAMAEVEIAERGRKRDVTIVGVPIPGWRRRLEQRERAIDLRLLTIDPRLHLHVLGPEAAFVDDEQPRIE